ncbi:hypothetical protein Pyn_32804 [Prunus yedoensis var. nudiflora]|uniref:Uncharacterized protein n=1 Tax=Prunus yedoensis var. nudiflora TaxID=2094558 RepID=A0A314U5V2_PRUYE|nr:hypothetical protein Pyn_32804 [Prunus yedoensis var. nudiflora]
MCRSHVRVWTIVSSSSTEVHLRDNIMEGEPDTTPPPLIPPFPRDSRGSLEVFNPSSSSSSSSSTLNTSTSPFRSQHTWQSWIDPSGGTTLEPEPVPNSPPSPP